MLPQRIGTMTARGTPSPTRTTTTSRSPTTTPSPTRPPFRAPRKESRCRKKAPFSFSHLKTGDYIFFWTPWLISFIFFSPFFISVPDGFDVVPDVQMRTMASSSLRRTIRTRPGGWPQSLPWTRSSRFRTGPPSSSSPATARNEKNKHLVWPLARLFPLG